MDVESFLESVRRDPAYAGQIVHMHTEPARTARWAPIPPGLHSEIRRFLAAQGVTRLYRHQAEAVEAALGREDVLVTTSAASGKSLCYQLPVLQGLMEDPLATALFIFPTKALARDQMASWNEGVEALRGTIDPASVWATPFDADAGSADRRKARDRARVLVTNPEMIHMRLLPGHGRWARIFRGLRYIVLDEAHTYAGFFGANMANVLRRMKRVCAHYGSRPQFFCLSATLGNPLEMACRVTGRQLHHVLEDTSAAGSRTCIFWNPPRIKKRRWRGRRSANVEAHELMVKLVRQGVATICFSKARNTAEMIYRYVRDSLVQKSPALAKRVVAYRGGYSSQVRRELERRLREGELLGVSATRALELGIDVGSLDACIVVGYPGTLNALFQQTGRAGRAGRDSLCILVGIDTPINQYIMQHPEFIFGRPIERAVIDQDNPFVVLGQIRCAAADLPLAAPDVETFGYASSMALDVLEETCKVRQIEEAWYHASAEEPALDVRIRGYGDESTVVMDLDTGKVIDRLDKFRALRLFYPGAISFHRGDTYAMVDHDFERNVVRVSKVDVPYYTDPVSGTTVDHIDTILEQRKLGTGMASLGEVYAVLSTPVYEKVQFYTLDRISQHETHVPPIAYEAMSFWLTPPPHMPAAVARLGMSAESGMKGILYCVSRILPLFLTSDANDFDWSLGCRNAPWHTMFWFEFYMHGIGNAEQCYDRLEEILQVTLDHLLTCDCEDGCPNCTSRLITPYHVRNIELGEGYIHSRRAAVVVLDSLLAGRDVRQSLALLDAPRKRRGMQLLPTVTGEHHREEPNRMPLNERTRALMLRKVERSRGAKLPVDHPIEPVPRVGMPPLEKEETLTAADSEKRSGHVAIRHKGDPTARRLRRRLELAAKTKKLKTQPAGESTSLPEEPLPTKTIRAGDEVARRARKRKRRSS